MSAPFESFGLSPALVQVLGELGFQTPTPVQIAAIPALIQGRDLIGRSATGSGKTLAFALPILQRLDLRERRLQALVLCPTRELCAQVAGELRKLGRRLEGLRVVQLVGGEPLFRQAEALEWGPHLAVATPGRLIDHLQRGLDLRGLRTLVLDEADRMLDMGFEAQVDEVLQATPPQRQTVLFSATFPAAVNALAQRTARDPVRITIEEEAQNTPQIEQLAFEVEPEQKLPALLNLLARHPGENAVIFCNLKVDVASLGRSLADAGLAVGAIHGDLEQADRDEVLACFRNGSTPVLVATDVAARGLDIEGLDVVYNYDLPGTPEDYTHRVGRTGRAGREGVAITFFTPKQAARLARFEETMPSPLMRRRVPALASAAVEAEGLRRAWGAVPALRTLRVHAGRRDKLRPGDILGALTGEAGGLDAAQVGKIEIRDRVAYVAVEAEVAEGALRSLNEGRVKGRHLRVTLVG